MLLCGLSLVGPSMGLEQFCCQTMTRLVIMTGAVSCLQSPTLLLNISSQDRVLDQWSPPIPKGQWGQGKQRDSYHPIPRPPLSPRHSVPLYVFALAFPGLYFLGGINPSQQGLKRQDKHILGEKDDAVLCPSAVND